jgi:hypothetical protein
MMVYDSTREMLRNGDRGISREPFFCKPIGIKHRQFSIIVWQRDGLFVAVVYLKTEYFKHLQMGLYTWYQHGLLVTVICLNFNNYSINLKVVIIHGRTIHC